MTGGGGRYSTPRLPPLPPPPPRTLLSSDGHGLRFFLVRLTICHATNGIRTLLLPGASFGLFLISAGGCRTAVSTRLRGIVGAGSFISTSADAFIYPSQSVSATRDVRKGWTDLGQRTRHDGLFIVAQFAKP